MEKKELKLLNAGDVSELVGLSKRTIHRFNSSGQLPAPIHIGGAVRWRQLDIERWIELGCPDRKTFEVICKSRRVA